MSVPESRTVYGFGDWEIDVARRELRLHGRPIPLGGRAFDIVEVLVQSAGQLVTKDDLMAAVWPGMVVEENTLQVHISAVRRALGTDRRMLKTASGRGYRFDVPWARKPQSASPSPAPAESHSPLPRATVSNLPLAGPELVGRSAELERLQVLLSAYRIVTLTGVGGIGKTVLALQAARALREAFDGGGWVVELVALSDPELVSPTVARILGIVAVGGGEISPQALASSLGAKKLLLVLDSCEHLVDAVARLVETLVRLCPNVSVIATSREALRIAGEHVYRVAPLDVPPEHRARSDGVLEHSAVQLFVSRIQAANQEFLATPESLWTIGAICRRLDGIPLAIEFAAARAALLGPRLVLLRLDERFALLAGGHRTAALRHQTLRATLDWSYDLLPESEKRLLRRLSVFVGGFTVEAASAVMAEAGMAATAVIEGVANLAAKSLVSLDGATRGRWRLLETIRAYALEKLVESGETAAVARSHARYFRDLLAPPESRALLRFTSEELAGYQLEIHNVRSALDWAFSAGGDSAIGIALTAAYAPIWLNLALRQECQERTERALASQALDADLSAPLLMQLNLGLGVSMFVNMAPVEGIEPRLNRALAIADKLGDPIGQLRTLWPLWALKLYTGRCREALSVAERFQTIALQTDEPFTLIASERLIGYALAFAGRLSDARRCFERILELPARKEQARSIWGQYEPYILSRAMLARTLCLEGSVDQAAVEAQKSLEQARTKDPTAQFEVLRIAVAPMMLMIGDLTAAERAITQLCDVAVNTNHPCYQVLSRGFEGMLLVRRGEFQSGVRTLRTVLNQVEGTAWTTSYPEMLGSLAQGLAEMRLLHEALATVEKAQAFTELGGECWYVPELLRLHGELLLRGGDGDTASEAEQTLQKAIEMARGQGALLWELRAALSLARYWKRRQRLNDAKRVLQPIYERFSEGFATADLRAAKDLLVLP